MEDGYIMIIRKGFTLIELAIFIVIMGVLTSGVLGIFSVALRHMPALFNATESVALAQKHMEFIIGQREMYGYASFTDPCSGGSAPVFCAGPSATSSITAVADGKQIVVSVASPYPITLYQLVTDY